MSARRAGQPGRAARAISAVPSIRQDDCSTRDAITARISAALVDRALIDGAEQLTRPQWANVTTQLGAPVSQLNAGTAPIRPQYNVMEVGGVMVQVFDGHIVVHLTPHPPRTITPTPTED